MSKASRWWSRCRPAVLGIIDDAYFRFVTDMGQFGPDQGKGGKFLLVREDYTGRAAKRGYYVVRTRTNNNLVIIRAFVQNGDLAGTVSRRQGENPDVSAFGGRQSAGAEVRQHLGPQVQHGPRQRLQVLRGAERGRAARAGRFRSIRTRSGCLPRSGSRRASHSRPMRG